MIAVPFHDVTLKRCRTILKSDRFEMSTERLESFPSSRLEASACCLVYRLNFRRSQILRFFFALKLCPNLKFQHGERLRGLCWLRHQGIGAGGIGAIDGTFSAPFQTRSIHPRIAPEKV